MVSTFKFGTCFHSMSDMSVRFALVVCMFLAFSTSVVEGVTDLTQTDAAPTPTTGTVHGTITNRQTTVTTKNSGAGTEYNTEIFVVDLFTSSPSCEPTSVTSTCQIGCAPFNSPNTASPSCTSSTLPSSPSVYYATGDVVDNGNGDYDITYYPEVSGVYDISIMRATQGGLEGNYYDNVWFVSPAALTQIDATIDFQWGTGALTTYGVDYVSVRWTGKVEADNTESYTIYAYADDGVRVWIDKQLIIDSWDICCTESWGVVSLTAGHLHDIIVEYQELSGEATMELRWSSPSVFKEIIPATNLYYLEHINSSPFTAVTINAGEAADPAQTIATGTGLEAGSAGTAAPLSVTAYDVFGNVQDAVTASHSISVTGPDGSPTTSLVYVANGVYTGSYTVATSGVYSIDLIFSGSSIANSPWSVTIASGANSPTTSTASGAGLTATTAGAYTTFDVQVKDANSNNAIDDSSTVEVYIVKGAITIIGNVEYQTGGLYEVSYTPTEIGSYTTTVLVDGTTLPSTYTLVVSPGAAYVPNCDASGAGLSAGTAGVAATFQIQAKDVHGNNLATGAETFNVDLTGAATLSVTSSYSGSNGVHDVSFTPVVKGTYVMEVTIGSQHISGSPFTVVVAGGAVDASSSTATGTGISTATVGVESSITVQIVDTQGNAADGDSHTVAGVLTCGGTVNLVFTHITGTDGQYTGTYTPTEDGACSLAVTESASAISGSPFSVTVSVGAPDASSCTVLPTPGTTYTAGSTTTITITAIDASSNTHAAGGEEFTVLYDSTALTVTDAADGTYTFDLAPTIAGTYTTEVYVTNVGGLVGTYYSDVDMTNLVATRTDTSIEFDWEYGEAIAATTPADYFTVRWSGKIKVPYSETYTFYASISTHSGVRLYIDSTAIIDEWTASSGSTEVFGSVSLTANTYYDIQLDFLEETEAASITFSIESTSVSKQTVPSSYLYTYEHVSSSPYSTVVQPDAPQASTTTVADTPPGSPTTDLTALSSSVPSSLTVGVTYTFTVQARDVYGNLDDGGNTGFYTADLEEVDTSATTNGLVATDIGSGAFTIDLTPTLVGTNSLLSFYLSGTDIYGSPFTVQVLPGSVDANSCTSDLSTPATWTAGETQTFTITAKDAQSNSLTSGGETFVVAGTGPATTNGVVTDNGDGTYSVSFTPTTAGAWTITISLGGTTINGGSAYTSITVEAASASAADCTIVGGIPTPVGGVADTIVVQAVDVYSNSHSADGEAFYVVITDVSDSSTSRATITGNGDGTYTLGFTVATGSYQVAILLAEAVGSDTNGLTGTYYHNRYLTGSSALSRVDSTISFSWGTDLITATAKDYVSVSWTGYIVSPGTSAMTFYLTFADGVRLFVDDVLILDEWDAGTSPANVAYTFAAAALLYPIRIDFKHTTGSASVLFEWDIGSGQVTVPSSVLYPTGAAVASSPYSMTVS